MSPGDLEGCLTILELREAPSFSLAGVLGPPPALTFEEVGKGGPGWLVCRMEVPDGQAGVPANITALSDACRAQPPQTILISEGEGVPSPPPSPPPRLSRGPSRWFSIVYCYFFPHPPLGP